MNEIDQNIKQSFTDCELSPRNQNSCQKSAQLEFPLQQSGSEKNLLSMKNMIHSSKILKFSNVPD